MSDRTDRLLVVANITCPCPGLVQEVVQREPGEVLLVAPALNSRLRHWVSDVDGALAAAAERLEVARDAFAIQGVDVRCQVGDSDPFIAITDALDGFGADAIFISTHPREHSNWLERGLIDRVRTRCELPVHHIVSRYGLPVAVAL